MPRTQQEDKLKSSSDIQKVKVFVISFYLKKLEREDQVKPNIGRLKVIKIYSEK